MVLGWGWQGLRDLWSHQQGQLHFGSLFPSPEKGVGPHPSLLGCFFGRAPWNTGLVVHYFGLWGECRTFNALPNVSQDTGMGGGQLIPKGHHIPTCLCLEMPRGLAAKAVGCSAGLAPARRPCQGPVARRRSGCRGCGETKSSFHFVSTNCITSCSLCL